MEIMHWTCFINCSTGTMSVITAPNSQGYTRGLRKEGPAPTKSHKGSLFVLSHTQSPRGLRCIHTEAQARTELSPTDYGDTQELSHQDVIRSKLQAQPQGVPAIHPRPWTHNVT